MRLKFLLISLVLGFMFGCNDEFDKSSINLTLSSKDFQLDHFDNISFTNDNGLIISGSLNEKYTIIKTDKNLNVEWTRNEYEWGNLVYGSGWSSSFYSFQIVKVFQQNNGQYICFGTIREGTDMVWSSTLIIILTQYGSQIQKHRFDDMYVSNVLKTNDGSFILFGHVTTIKLDKNFNLQWKKNFRDNQYSPIQSTSISNGEFAITGGYHALQQVYLKTYDSNGNELLGKIYKNNSNSVEASGRDILQLGDDGFLIVGRAARFSPRIMDCHMIRTNENGDTIWTRRFSYSMDSWFDHIVSHTSNEFVIEGTIGHPDEKQKSILMKIDDNGQVLDSLSENKFEMITRSPLGYFIKVTQKDSDHFNLSMIDAVNLFDKE